MGELIKDETAKRDAVLDAVRQNPGQSSAAIINAADVTRSRGYQLLTELQNSGAIISEDGKNKTKRWFAND
jgi:hypothetical protein